MPRRSAASLSAITTPEPAVRLRPPADLSADEKQEFLKIVCACRSDHFQPAEQPLLALLCRAIVAERRSAAALAAEPVVNDKPSPWLLIWTAQARTVTVAMRTLRLTPQSRPPLATQEQRTSYYERMALEQRDDEVDAH